MRGVPLLALLLAASVVPGAVRAETVADAAHALVAARARSTAALARAAELERAAAAAGSEARRAQAREAAVAARIRAAAADIAAAEARVRIVGALRVRQRARLADARAPLAGMAAALQTMARRPAALALVQPGTIADAVHVRALLGAALPAVQERTARLRAAIAEGDRLALAAAAAAGTLRDGRRRLDEQRRALAALEARQSAASAALASSAIVETDRALALGEEARDIVDRMEELGQEETTQARLAGLAGPVLRPPVPGRPPPPPEPARPYRLPVGGRLVTGFGELAETGVRARGLTLETHGGADVAAPLPARVAYAAPFRSYGRIVILDHGAGWTTLVTGLGTLAVKAGDTLAAGDTLGRAPADRPRITVELRHALRPVDPAPLVGPG